MLKAEVVHGLGGLLALEDRWNSLFEASGNRSFYNDWRWHAAIARHLIKDGLVYLTLRDGRRLVAVFPIQFRRSVRGLRFRLAVLPSHPHVLLSDAVVHADYLRASVLRALHRSLRHAFPDGWQQISFSRFTKESNLMRLHEEAGIAVSPAFRCFFASAAPPGAGGESVSGKQLRNCRRLEARALDTFGPVDTVEVSDPAELGEAFDEFLRIEASGWKGMPPVASSILLHPNLAAFYRELVETFGGTGQAIVSLLKVGDKFAAANFSLLSAGTRYLLKIGYDPEFGNIGPGNLLLKEILTAARPPYSRLHLGTAPRWAERWHLDDDFLYRGLPLERTLSARALQRIGSWTRAIGLRRDRRDRRQNQ